jgi:DNA-binding response OmpR family regulator
MSAAYPRAGTNSEADAIIGKPFDLDTLEALVQRLPAGRRRNRVEASDLDRGRLRVDSGAANLVVARPRRRAAGGDSDRLPQAGAPAG